ncbi:MAG: response regulator [Chloroflexi bacterium]|nr:response regulator [Chloroflexota bacterium]
MNPHIVWIEDDVDIIGPVVEPLEEAGYRITRMTSIRSARAQLETIRRADLLLLDVIAPLGGNGPYPRYAGVQFLRELRQEHGITTPAVVFTVVIRPEVHQELRELGVLDIIGKPTLPSKLQERIERVLASLRG